MDIDPGYLFASLVVSGVGFIVFGYGRRQRRFPHMCIGALMMGYPYVVTNIPLMLGLVPVLLAVLWLLTRLGI